MSDSPMEPVTVAKNDVIQIAPEIEATSSMFWGKLALVDEVRPWGVKCHIATFEGDAHLRMAWGTFALVGPAPFIVPETEDETP